MKVINSKMFTVFALIFLVINIIGINFTLKKDAYYSNGYIFDKNDLNLIEINRSNYITANKYYLKDAYLKNKFEVNLDSYLDYNSDNLLNFKIYKKYGSKEVSNIFENVDLIDYNFFNGTDVFDLFKNIDKSNFGNSNLFFEKRYTFFPENLNEDKLYKEFIDRIQNAYKDSSIEDLHNFKIEKIKNFNLKWFIPEFSTVYKVSGDITFKDNFFNDAFCDDNYNTDIINIIDNINIILDYNDNILTL